MSSRPRARLLLARLLWRWKPHPTQREWLLCDAKTKVAACGRRWGKTEAAAVDAASMAVLEPGSVQMIVSPSYDQSRLIFDTVERLMLGSPITQQRAKVVRTPYPRLTAAGSVIMARTADEDGRNLRGHSADRVIVDEAAYVRDSVIAEVISPMLADTDGQLVMISTPFGKNHFYRAFLRGQVERGEQRVESSRPSTLNTQHSTVSFTFPSWENPHISREYIERQRRELSPRQFAVEYEAQFVDDQRSVFAWEDIEAAASGFPQPSTLDAQPACVVAGIDWARYSDYSAAVAVAVTESGCEVMGIDRFNRMSWEAQTRRAAQFLRAYRVCAVLTDSTSIGDPVLEQLRSTLSACGFECWVEGYAFTNASKRELIEHLSIKLAHRELAIPRDERLINELRHFEYQLTESGNVRMNARSGYSDDLVIALALACRQARGMGFAGRYLARSGRVAAGAEW